MSDTADFFLSPPDQMIDLRHPLAVLPSRMPLQELEASVLLLSAKKVRAAKVIDEAEPLVASRSWSVLVFRPQGVRACPYA